MKSLIFQPAVRLINAEDTQTVANLPVSVATSYYSRTDKQDIDRLYAFYIERLIPSLYASYQRNSDKYLSSNKRPTATQAKHHILLWFVYFCQQGEMTPEHAATFLYGEIGRPNLERQELLLKMFAKVESPAETTKPEEFTNGFDSWYPTYASAIRYIVENRDDNGRIQGMSELVMYDVAKEWADEFELKFKGQDWDSGLQWDEETERFFNQKNRPGDIR